jgi:ubiquinone/menaquinone biosynthesis C-methylase UbiE
MSTELVRIYSRWAFAYDAWTWLTERTSLDRALECAKIVDGDAILEVAVGTGWLFRKIVQRNLSGCNVGVDLTEQMLRRARTRLANMGAPCELVLGDARALAFENDSFDVVINSNLFGLLPEGDFAPILDEAWRVLRPRGRLVLVTMQRPSRPLGRAIYEAGAVRLGGWRDVVVEPHVRNAGFVELTQETVDQLGIPSNVLVAHKSGLTGRPLG